MDMILLLGLLKMCRLYFRAEQRQTSSLSREVTQLGGLPRNLVVTTTAAR